MRPIHCIAIDDEPLALLIIEQFCKRTGNINLSTFSEPSHGLKAIEEQKPDIVFLDIEMSSYNGIDIAKTLPENCKLIFTTAHAQYAIDGFELNAIDFLHKPFSYERFERALQKALKVIETDNKIDYIIVKQEYNNISVAIDSILYVEAMENYIKIYRENQDYILSRTSLKNLHEMLPQNRFIRIHRSFLIPIDKISSFSKKEIHLNGEDKTFPIGRQYQQDVLNYLSEIHL